MEVGMKMVQIASVLVLVATAAHAGSHGEVKGNDTWSCEAEAVAVEIAAQHCSSYGKDPRITSVHRQYGDFIAFNCLWTPYIARFQLPGVPTRSACSPPHPTVLPTK